jgi:hypothetical protein
MKNYLSDVSSRASDQGIRAGIRINGLKKNGAVYLFHGSGERLTGFRSIPSKARDLRYHRQDLRMATKATAEAQRNAEPL